MIDTILLDLDDTILDFHKAEASAIRKSLIDMDLSATDEIAAEYSRINAAQWALLEKKVLTRDEILHRRFDLLFDYLNVTRDSDKMLRIYENYLSQGHYFIDGAEDVLGKLKADYRLYLVSNGTLTVQKSRIKSAGIAPCFEDIFISEEIGCDKPSARFFDICFKKAGNIRRRDTVIVGDSLSSDILGGINAGIRTVWYNPRRKPIKNNVVPDYQIDTLSALIPLVKSI